MMRYIKFDPYGAKYYYQDNLLHREDGPAIEYSDNSNNIWFNTTSKYYYQNGKLHRENGPAIEFYSDVKSIKYYYQNGKLHRENGPAIECSDGSKYYYQNSKLHREDGPAIEFYNGIKHWYYLDKEINCSSLEEFKKLIANEE